MLSSQRLVISDCAADAQEGEDIPGADELCRTHSTERELSVLSCSAGVSSTPAKRSSADTSSLPSRRSALSWAGEATQGGRSLPQSATVHDNVNNGAAFTVAAITETAGGSGAAPITGKLTQLSQQHVVIHAPML